MRLSPIRLGFALGSTWGLGIFLVSLIAIAQNQSHLAFELIAIYPGYELTLSGAALGFFWGFIDGFFGGYLIAWIYNSFSSSKLYTKCCTALHCDDCGSCSDCGESACRMCTGNSCSVPESTKKKTKPKAKPKKKKAPTKKKTK